MLLSRRSFAQALAGLGIGAASGALVRTAAAAGTPFKVALLLPGSVADGGWNTLAFDGLQALDKTTFKTAYSESVPQAQMEGIIRGYGDDGYDLIIGHSYEYGSAFDEIGPDYPKTKFFASTFKPGEKAPPNVEFVDLAYLQGAYGAGALAALISDKGKAVGTDGGGDNPTQQAMARAFVAGAEKTRPGIKGLAVVTGDYNNAAKGREAATTMVGNGADVIWHTADVTGLGAMQGAAAAKVKAIGSFSDQTDIAPDYMATSLKQNLDWMVGEVSKSAVSGSFMGGQEWAPKTAQVWTAIYAKSTYNPKLVTAAQWATFTDIWSKLDAGAIDVRSLIKT